MTSRVNPYDAHFGLVKPLIDFGMYAHEGVDPTVAALVELRASQINGCAPCLFMHARDARKQGETEERIDILPAWRESSLYSARERAALEWTEALTRIHDTGAPEQAYRALQAHFSEEEQVKLTLLIVAINGFNRLNVGFHVPHPVAASRKVA